jgi:hypothetical protein
MNRKKSKSISRLRWFVSFACLLHGFLAGENMFRYTMEVPGWRHINIAAWGEYSLHADLGNGIFLLPVEAIVGAILLLLASLTIVKGKEEFQSAAFPVHSATFFALAGLLFTFFAAPYMLSVRTMVNDPVLLQDTFNHFHHWGFLRATAQVLSFCFCVWSMAKVFELVNEPE